MTNRETIKFALTLTDFCNTAIKAIQTIDRIKAICDDNKIHGNLFGQEVCEAISEYLYDTKQGWET